jgi:hypothetical protein
VARPTYHPGPEEQQMSRHGWTTIATAALLLAALAAQPARADEGMWTLDNFPSARVKQQFGVDIDQRWLDRVRLGSIRLGNCSASFVSRNGLILTNHHCTTACLAENSTPQRSLLDEGHVALDPKTELRCPTQVADVLMALENVTDQVEAATRGLDDTAANEARKRRLTEIESACEAAAREDRRSGPLKCETVTLYGGGRYFLHKYKRYSDVRLVFAPEDAIGAFGGDPDNFQFPRWCLDMALLRAYENGKPVRVADPLRIRFEGPEAGEFVLVSGHPGGTDRQLTVAQLGLLRDTDLPQALYRGMELRGRHIQFSKTGEEARRIAAEPLGNLENGLKVRRKLLDALLDEGLMARKRAEESTLRAGAGAAAPGLSDPWADIERAATRARELWLPYTHYEGVAGFNSRLFRYARQLVRAAEERNRPNTERLREFTDGALPRVEQQLLAPVPVYPALERLTLSFSLERMREWLGPDEPTIRRLLSQDSPDTLAAKLIDGSKLGDPAVRKALWEGGAAAIAASTDPMIVLARGIDAESRAVRKRFEDEVEAPTRVASERIAAARFAVFGTDVYPDATFTLRLNYGTVQGWKENGVQVEPFTRLAHAYERATGQDPFALPQRWLDAKPRLDLNTSFNLSTNNDIIGGNSGSPLLNTRGEVVGLVFDGNIHSISGDYWFDAEKNRTVAVHPAIIKVALTQVYGADALYRELGGE